METTIFTSAKEELTEKAREGLVANLELRLIELGESIESAKGDSKKIEKYVEAYWLSDRTAEMVGIEVDNYRARYKELIGNHNEMKYGEKLI